MEKIFLMPFQILLRHLSLPYGQELYSENSKRMIDARKVYAEERSNSWMTSDFSESLYCDSLSINSIEDVSDFMAKYPDVRLLNAKRLLPMNMYSNQVIRAIREYRALMDLSHAFSAYDEMPDCQNAKTVCEAFLRTPSQRFFDVPGAEYRIREGRIVRESIQQLLKPDADSIEENPELYKQHFTKIRKWLSDYIEKVLAESRVQYNSATRTVEYICGTVISGMYMYNQIASFNRDEYRLCSHKKCNKYYLVDRSHPQKFCPEHMVARQNKRKNYANNLIKRGIEPWIESE